MMELELKKKVLGELFTIKSCLSIIAEENDKIESAKGEIARNADMLNNNGYTADSIKRTMDDLQRRKQEEEKGMAAVFMRVGKRLGGLAIGVILSAISFLVGVSLLVKDVDFETGAGIMGVALMSLGLIFVICVTPFILFAKDRTRLTDADYYRRRISEIDRSYRDNEQRLKQLEAHTTLTESEKSYLNTKLKCQINESTPIVQGTYQFMLDNCRNYITELHFQYVDLLIYYIYSGVADTIKEALQELMKDLRNEMVLEELRSEGSLLRATIRSGFDSLAYEINQGFKEIGSQIANNHNEAMKKMSGIESTISTHLSNIEAEQKPTNSLNANINKSSVEAGKSLRNIEQYIYLYGKR